MVVRGLPLLSNLPEPVEKFFHPLNTSLPEAAGSLPVPVCLLRKAVRLRFSE
jgi:hypothetical protein